MEIAFVGHVDHGKSTIVGRLLADTGSLPQGKLDQIRAFCEANARPFEYAFLLDALRNERAQGITIDVARVFFKSGGRAYTIHDTPGHAEFLKNMVSGAARADAALLVLDGHEGVQENSRRHAYLLSMLGIRQVAVLVNKMDLLDRDQGAFDALVASFGQHLARFGLVPAHWIPVVGRTGENLAARSGEMAWYHGPTLLEALAGFEAARPLEELPFRLPVQDVYKFTANGDTRRIVAGTVESGRAEPGDELVFHPSGKRSRIRSLEAFPGPGPALVSAGMACGFTLEEPVYLARGEVAAKAGEPGPICANRFRASLFWLGKRPLHSGRDYLLKLGTARVRARLERIVRVLDASTLEPRETPEAVARHEVGEVVLRLARPIAFDPGQLPPAMSRFVLVDDFEISGGGLLLEGLAEGVASGRAARFNQRPLVILLAQEGKGGAHDHGLDLALSDAGRAVYPLPALMAPFHKERLTRMAEQARLLLDAGLLVLLPVSEPRWTDLDALKGMLPEGRLKVVWIGDGPAPAGLHADLAVDPREDRTLSRAILRWTGVDAAEAVSPLETGH